MQKKQSTFIKERVSFKKEDPFPYANHILRIFAQKTKISFPEVNKYANKLIEDPETGSTSSPAYNWYFLAMAHHKLGHEAEAEKWLDKANEWTDKVIRENEEGTTTLAWNRRLTLKLLRTEAEGMIELPDQPKDDTETEQKEDTEAKRLKEDKTPDEVPSEN